MDILGQTVRKEGFFALYKGQTFDLALPITNNWLPGRLAGMASPLIGIAAVNSLLFASYAASKRIVSPFPVLSLPETSLAGNQIYHLQSYLQCFKVTSCRRYGRCRECSSIQSRYGQAWKVNPSDPNRTKIVEMFKVRMQGQYGSVTDKKLRDVAREMWSTWGFRKGVMRGYWVCYLGLWGCFYHGLNWLQ